MTDFAPPNGVDWRDLFRRYADHVGVEEGTDFLDSLPLSEDERAAINDLGMGRAPLTAASWINDPDYIDPEALRARAAERGTAGEVEVGPRPRVVRGTEVPASMDGITVRNTSTRPRSNGR